MIDPDDLIHRLDKGGRTPELLRQLDRLAWEAFHDPGEDPPLQGFEAAPGPPPGAHLFEADAIHPVCIELVMSALDEMELPHTISPTGELMVPFGQAEDGSHATRMILSVQGEGRHLLVWRMMSSRRLKVEEFGLAFRLCNDWAVEKHWAKAFVDIHSPEVGGWPPAVEPAGSIELSFHYPLPDGISRQGLVDVLIALCFSGLAFWVKARKDYFL